MLQPGNSVQHQADTRPKPVTMTVYIVKDSKAFCGHTTYAGETEGKWYNIDNLVVIKKGSFGLGDE